VPCYSGDSSAAIPRQHTDISNGTRCSLGSQPECLSLFTNTEDEAYVANMFSLLDIPKAYRPIPRCRRPATSRCLKRQQNRRRRHEPREQPQAACPFRHPIGILSCRQIPMRTASHRLSTSHKRIVLSSDADASHYPHCLKIQPNRQWRYDPEVFVDGLAISSRGPHALSHVPEQRPYTLSKSRYLVERMITPSCSNGEDAPRGNR